MNVVCVDRVWVSDMPVGVAVRESDVPGLRGSSSDAGAGEVILSALSSWKRMLGFVSTYGRDSLRLCSLAVWSHREEGGAVERAISVTVFTLVPFHVDDSPDMAAMTYVPEFNGGCECESTVEPYWAVSWRSASPELDHEGVMELVWVCTCEYGHRCGSVDYVCVSGPDAWALCLSAFVTSEMNLIVAMTTVKNVSVCLVVFAPARLCSGVLSA